MNKIKNSDRKVVSKYFKNVKTMDDSASHFKETIRKCKGPKTVPEKQSASNNRKRKPKGQKDIRKLWKAQTDLVSYTENFNKVCRQNGINVDGEQLQIAIALSKSIESTDSCLKPTNSQEKIVSIKQTLKEYGFKSGTTKVSTQRKKKCIKSLKNSKLFLLTEEQKQQIIADKYAQILFENIPKSQKSVQQPNLGHCNIYSKSKLDYASAKDNLAFYVDGLFEVANNKLGCSLKSWSEIPGRPKSPTYDSRHTANIFALSFTQDEIDNLLSGTLIVVDNLIKNKTMPNMQLENHSKYNDNVELNVDTVDIEIVEILKNSDTLISEVKNCSPDLFDDEVTIINESVHQTSSLDNTSNHLVSNFEFKPVKELVLVEPLSQEKNFTHRKSNDLMELTEICNSNVKTICTVSQNFTKRVSNDFMDLTGCVKPQHKCLDIDKNNCIVISEETMDLTQSSDSLDNTLPCVDLKNKLCDENVCKEVLEIDSGNTLGSNSDFEDFNYNHSSKESIETIETHDVDPTQSDHSMQSNTEVIEISHLGKTDNVSFDFDEIDIGNDYVKKEIAECKYANEDGLDFVITKDVLKNDRKESNGPIEEIKLDEIIQNDEEVHTKLDAIILLEKETITPESVEVEFNSHKELGSYYDENPIINSQQEEVFIISDDELNYSVQKSRYDNIDLTPNFDCGGISVLDHFDDFGEEINSTKKSVKKSESILPIGDVKDTKGKIKSPEIGNPRNEETVITPKSSKYIIKTTNVTPMLEYEALSTPERNKELDKYGLKPFKRKRAIQLLKHLYDQTHPMIETNNENPLKKPKSNASQSVAEPSSVEIENLYDETTLEPVITHLDCKQEDWVFQKREKAKIHSCRVPLHVAFHNYISSRRLLREAILKYEPINIEVIHKDLISYGFRYDPKDLLKFLDKKCITVRTADNAKNKRRS